MSVYTIDPVDFTTTINDNTPTTNYGSAGNITAAYALTYKTYTWRAIIVADISSLIGQTVSPFSYLRLRTGVPLVNTDTPCTLYRLTQAGVTEDGATWNKYDGTNNWVAPGGDYSTPSVPFVFPAGPGANKEVFITGTSFAAFCQDALVSRSGIARMLLRVDNELGLDQGGDFYSGDIGTIGPKLVVVYGVGSSTMGNIPTDTYVPASWIGGSRRCGSVPSNETIVVGAGPRRWGAVPSDESVPADSDWTT